MKPDILGTHYPPCPTDAAEHVAVGFVRRLWLLRVLEPETPTPAHTKTFESIQPKRFDYVKYTEEV